MSYSSLDLNGKVGVVIGGTSGKRQFLSFLPGFNRVI